MRSLWSKVNTLRGRLMALVFLALLPFLGVILVLTVNQRRAGVAQATDNALGLARLATLDQERQIEQVHELLTVISQLPEAQPGSGEGCQQVLSNLASAYNSVANIGVIDMNGDLVCSALSVSGPVNLADREYFQRTLDTRAFSAGEYQIGRVTGIASINFGLPLYGPKGAIQGVVFGALDLESMNALAAQAALPEGSSLILVDNTGTVLVHFPQSKGWIGRSIGDSQLFQVIKNARPQTTAQLADPDGTARLYGITQLEGGSARAAYVAVGIPTSSALALANQTLTRGLLSLALATLAGLVLAYLGGEAFVLKRVRRLLDRTHALAEGDLTSRVGAPYGQDELGELAGAFDQMASALEARGRERDQSVSALQESEGRFRALVEESLAGVYIIQGGKFQYVNSVLAATFGYEPEELIGQLGPEDLTDPSDQQRVADNIQRRISGEEQSIHYEFQGLTKSGGRIDVEVLGSVIEMDGVRSVIGTLIDVTDRRRSQAQIERQVRRLNALRAIDMAITASLDPRVTFNVLLDQAVSQLEVDAAAILYYDPHARRLNHVAGRGFITDALQHTSLRIGEGFAGQAAQDRKLLSVKDLNASDGEFGRSPHLKEEAFVSYFAMPLISKGSVQGVLEIFNRSALDPAQEWLDFMEALAGQAAIAIDNAQMFDALHKSNQDLMEAYDTTLEGWSRALELRDRETEGHTRRVTEVTLRLAQMVGIDGAELIHLRRGALLHDIGKMGIPDEILRKPGPLSEEEWSIMRKHPVYAYDLLSPIEYLRPALGIPYCHHEKWDGTGYPRHLEGEAIPISARIFAVVDVWDALRSDRPYRPAWEEERVRAYLAEQKSKHFDPGILDAFLDLEIDVRETFQPPNSSH
jgi:PAS domain S-box-containing protein